jgi:kynurenine formamidase
LPNIPTVTEVFEYASSLSNWGRWGPDDEKGTLNLISDGKRKRALGNVRYGVAVSLSWDIDPSIYPESKPPPQRYMIRSGEGIHDAHRLHRGGRQLVDPQDSATEFIGLIFHDDRVTHLDGLSHRFWRGNMYNGFPAEWVTAANGATKNSVTSAREGFVTRGILIDVPRHRDVQWLEPGEPVHHDEVEQIVAKAGLELEEGDALLLRTGFGRRREIQGPELSATMRRAGWHASCLPLFHRYGMSLIGADTANDVLPSGYEETRGPVHGIGIAAMGLWLIDNCNLEALGEACERYGTLEFAFLGIPLPFVGATGSPLNPVAIF